MQQTKYFIEGMEAAHNGSVRACRYNRDANRNEWFNGYDSVDREYVLIRVNTHTTDHALPEVLKQSDPVYLGSVTQCQDRAVTLQQTDRNASFVIFHLATGKPYQYKGIGDN